ncbi:MAG: sporulation integral membrane protein YtvI [Peptococcaceae bacterium]|nr:sporulation integral membrane protein YtvI [Peptococcaceae bacterium]
MTTEKRKTFLINFTYFSVILVTAFLLLYFVMPLASPFVIGFLIAWLLQRPIRFLRKKLPLPDKLIAVLSVILFYGTAGLLLALLGIKAFSEIAALIARIPTLYTTQVQPFLWDVLLSLENAFVEMDPSLVSALNEMGNQFVKSLGERVTNWSVAAMGLISGAASSLPALFIKLVLMIISTFFIAIDYDRLTGFCLRQFSDRGKNIFVQVKEYVVGTLWVCICSYALIMSITFVELSILLTLIGIEHSVLVAFCTAIFDILPVLGTGGIMIPWAVLTAVSGNYILGLKLAGVYVVVTVVRNIIEPKIVGGQLGLHPIVTLTSMFVGVQLLGVVGLFGFPIGLSLLRYLNDHGVIRILK